MVLFAGDGEMLTQTGPLFAVAHIKTEKLPLAFPYSFDCVTAIDRFMGALASPAE